MVIRRIVERVLLSGCDLATDERSVSAAMVIDKQTTIHAQAKPPAGRPGGSHNAATASAAANG
jgi:hypothetical protein